MCSRRSYSPLLAFSLCCFVLATCYWVTKEINDGNYTEWSSWSSCSKDCGEGIQTRIRTCQNPAPGKFGKDCFRLGSSKDEKPCFLKICPMDGKYGQWTGFSTCDKTCGGGKQFRTRVCNNPPAAFGGKNCEGPSKHEQSCNTEECPAVHGGFSEWSAFGACSVTCGEGKKSRSRSCTNPPPSHGGKPCSGPTSDRMPCDEGSCPMQKQTSDQTAQKPLKQADQNTNKPAFQNDDKEDKKKTR